MKKNITWSLVAATIFCTACNKEQGGSHVTASNPAPAVGTVVQLTRLTPSAGMKNISIVASPGATINTTTGAKPILIPPSTVAITSNGQAMLRIDAHYSPVMTAAKPGFAKESVQVAQKAPKNRAGDRQLGAIVRPGDFSTHTQLIKVESRQMGDGPVLAGLDVLEKEHFNRIKGKKVALLTNHSAVDRKGVHILDLLMASPDVKLVKLFSPEHGLYGNVDTKTADTLDTATGLMVHSLYSDRKDGKTKPLHPRLDDLKDIDLMIIDMQDIGAVYYTYPSYMAYMMEACAQAGVPVMVLDRPNPIGGKYVDGALTDDDLLGGVTTYFKMPTAHGMTIGELARMYNAENQLGCKLTVVPMENWKRDMYWDQTGLLWVNPSPNIQDMSAALVYPGIAMTEALVSMGRGTTEPFHVFGMPYIDAQKLVDSLSSTSVGLEGVKLEVTDFVPTGTLARGHAGEGKVCKGVRITITDRAKFRPYLLGLAVMDFLQGNYGSRIITTAKGAQVPQYDIARVRNAASSIVCMRLIERKSLRSTLEFVDEQVKKFLPVRAKYLMYE